MGTGYRSRGVWLVVATLAAYVAAITPAVVRAGGDFGVLVTAGVNFHDEASARAAIPHLSPGGYDGQFYYRLTVAPFSFERTDAGVVLDKPAYRQQRIAYPLIARALAAGSPARAPLGLVLANLLAITIVTAIAIVLARDAGLASEWGLLIAFYPGFLLSVARDLAEVWACALLLSGLVLVRRQRFGWAALSLTAAVLTRETTMIFAGAIAAASWLGAASDRGRRAWLAMPFVVLGAWQVYLTHEWGHVPFLTGPGLTWPGRAYLGLLRRTALHGGTLELVWFAMAVGLGALGVLVALHLRRSTAESSVKLAWLAYGGLGLLLPGLVWVEDWAFLRAMSEFYVLGIVVLFGSRQMGKVARYGLAGFVAMGWTVEALTRLRWP